LVIGGALACVIELCNRVFQQFIFVGVGDLCVFGRTQQIPQEDNGGDGYFEIDVMEDDPLILVNALQLCGTALEDVGLRGGPLGVSNIFMELLLLDEVIDFDKALLEDVELREGQIGELLIFRELLFEELVDVGDVELGHKLDEELLILGGEGGAQVVVDQQFEQNGEHIVGDLLLEFRGQLHKGKFLLEVNGGVLEHPA
jgi:hypothetical protein